MSSTYLLKSLRAQRAETPPPGWVATTAPQTNGPLESLGSRENRSLDFRVSFYPQTSGHCKRNLIVAGPTERVSRTPHLSCSESRLLPSDGVQRSSGGKRFGRDDQYLRIAGSAFWGPVLDTIDGAAARKRISLFVSRATGHGRRGTHLRKNGRPKAGGCRPEGSKASDEIPDTRCGGNRLEGVCAQTYPVLRWSRV